MIQAKCGRAARRRRRRRRRRRTEREEERAPPEHKQRKSERDGCAMRIALPDAHGAVVVARQLVEIRGASNAADPTVAAYSGCSAVRRIRSSPCI
jgi:hypothetical protein